MKKSNHNNNPRPKKSLFRKLLIKLNRRVGYEIVDQANYTLPGLNKKGCDNLSTINQTTITIPFGNRKIERKVKSLHIIIRTCVKVKLVSQNKERLFAAEKLEYTLRIINSIIKSIYFARSLFKHIKLKLTIVDDNSDQSAIDAFSALLDEQFFEYEIISLEKAQFFDQIEPKNESGEMVTHNLKSLMSNFLQSILLGAASEDLVYLVEDDYLHKEHALQEMIFTYEKMSTLIGNELFLCPSDYPFLYEQCEPTQVVIGNQSHWRTVDQTLCTFLTSSQMINKYLKEMTHMCQFEHDPFEKPLHKIFEKEVCLSPLPTLALHVTNVNSAYGISPFVDAEALWAHCE